MTTGQSRILDDFAKLLTDAAGAAQGVRREVETAFRSQTERLLNSMDVVKREEFEAVRDMAAKARAENDALALRISMLEAKLGVGGASGTGLGDVGAAAASVFGESPASAGGSTFSSAASGSSASAFGSVTAGATGGHQTSQTGAASSGVGGTEPERPDPAVSGPQNI